jgi:hypothetical protein
MVTAFEMTFLTLVLGVTLAASAAGGSRGHRLVWSS